METPCQLDQVFGAFSSRPSYQASADRHASSLMYHGGTEEEARALSFFYFSSVMEIQNYRVLSTRGKAAPPHETHTTCAG